MLFLATPANIASTLNPVALRCEALVDPLGIGTAVPKLSWKLEGKGRNLQQTAYRIIVSSSKRSLSRNDGDLWDTGKIASSRTYGVPFAGKALGSGTCCWWKVQIWDQAGVESKWSKPGFWSVGLLEPGDWKAEWIGFDAPLAKKVELPSLRDAIWVWAPGVEAGHAKVSQALFRREFQVPAGIKKAVLKATADDQFSLKLNGKLVAASDGREDAWRRPVQSDVTLDLHEGTNILEATADNTQGDYAGMIFKITMATADGSTSTVISDENLLCSTDGGANFAKSNEMFRFGDGPWGWIGGDALFLPPPRYLRTDFVAKKHVARAILYGSALGLADFYLNGQRVGDEYFTPGWTDYAKRVHYRAYDVTRQVQAGGNGLGIILGDGWFAGYVGYGGRREHYGEKTRAIAQLVLEYDDGTQDIVASGKNWKAATGPIHESDFLMGEVFDAREEMAGWSDAGFGQGKWKPVNVGTDNPGKLEAFPGVPVRAFEVLKAKKISQPKPTDSFVLDLGQNMAGFARLKLKGEPGQKITLRYAERLNPDGTVYTTNLRGARATEIYVCKGGGVETWEPSFTFHGFQYIEVSGLGRRPSKDEVVGVAVSSDTPSVGWIETSDAMINKLVSNAWWTQRMNFIDVPTDCPQRDERLGWTGDAQAYIRTACMLTDAEAFYKKWLVALDDAQRADGQFPMVAPLKVAGDDGGPAWADAGVICPWTAYDVYGDRDQLARHYPQMKKFVDFYVSRSKPDLTNPDSFHCFGDWLQIAANTPTQVIYSAYFAYSTHLLADSARILGYTDDQAKYSELFQRLRRVFMDKYVAADGVVAGNTQCAYVLALAFDLLDPDLAKMAADHLVEDIKAKGWHLSTGFVGTRDIMHVLSKIGRNDVAFKLLHNTTFPSWGFTIVNGATSIWERWDGWTPEKGFQDPGMNSFAHYAFGAVVGWIMAQPGGITNSSPGFDTIRIAPQIDTNLKWMRAHYDSLHGPIACEWKLLKGGFSMKATVPPNTKAEIHVPVDSSQAITSDISPVEKRETEWVYQVGSGNYQFVCR